MLGVDPGDAALTKPLMVPEYLDGRVISSPISRPGRLEGKVAIVTGAGSTPGPGIGTGKATAVVLAREGASVCSSLTCTRSGRPRRWR
jgi:hypothetical protein